MSKAPAKLGAGLLAKKGQAVAGRTAVPASSVVTPADSVSNHPISNPVTAYPWAEASPRVKVPFQLRLTEPMHVKLKWLSDQKEGSIHEIVMGAVETTVAQLLAKHGVKEP